ncbi:uncharacterized protein LOC111081602 isoform X2 [Drosophila obscura]|uniref:uncharacterized protein LOC111081602 isoform X2 n=1 Tax=Drosophila obscura TaxID=7282 RepID=UPI001BB19A8E|nr:uncharacterized protein LOC111081602 isoform X2 [Drosophila obscura]
MHIEVTNGVLKEKVGTLENKIRQMESQLKESEERARCLEDELCQRMECEIGVFPEGLSLAHELYDSPAKRAKREEIKDLQSASLQLGCVLCDVERQSEADIPTYKEFQVIACSVNQLEQILAAKNPEDMEQPEMEHKQQLFSRRRKRKMLKRFIWSRIYRGRVRRRALQRSLSSNSFYSMSSLHTVHSDTSMLSFRSQHASLEAAPTVTADYVSIVQTESISTCVQAVQTELETSECYTQCDRVDVEQRLLLLPQRTRRFVELLQCEAEDVQRFRASLLQMWESSESFREHIELVQDLYWAQLPPPVESLEVFASAIGAVRDLAATMQPKSSFTLKKIEQRFNDRVLHLHCEMAKKTEPENPVKAMPQMGLVFTHVARPNPLFELLGIACNPNKESANI